MDAICTTSGVSRSTEHVSLCRGGSDMTAITSPASSLSAGLFSFPWLCVDGDLFDTFERDNYYESVCHDDRIGGVVKIRSSGSESFYHSKTRSYVFARHAGHEKRHKSRWCGREPREIVPDVL